MAALDIETVVWTTGQGYQQRVTAEMVSREVSYQRAQDALRRLNQAACHRSFMKNRFQENSPIKTRHLRLLADWKRQADGSNGGGRGNPCKQYRLSLNVSIARN